jgi:hypothetical protein
MGSDDIGLGVGGSAGGVNIARGAKHKIKTRSGVLSQKIIKTFFMFDV